MAAVGDEVDTVNALLAAGAQPTLFSVNLADEHCRRNTNGNTCLHAALPMPLDKLKSRVTVKVNKAHAVLTAVQSSVSTEKPSPLEFVSKENSGGFSVERLAWHSSSPAVELARYIRDTVRVGCVVRVLRSRRVTCGV